MKITVFGSTGKVGQEVLRQALSRGHSVTAYARRPFKISITHPRLSVIRGELDDLTGLAGAIRDSDCVISALGPGPFTSGTALSDGTKNIVAVMEESGVRRLIMLSTVSVSDARDRNDFIFKLLAGLIRLFFSGSYSEIVRMAESVRQSALDWTLVRVPILNQASLTKKVRIGYPGYKIAGVFLSRADLAWFMLEQAAKDGYIRQAPVISN